MRRRRHIRWCLSSIRATNPWRVLCNTSSAPVLAYRLVRDVGAVWKDVPVLVGTQRRSTRWERAHIFAELVKTGFPWSLLILTTIGPSSVRSRRCPSTTGGLGRRPSRPGLRRMG